MSYYFFDSSVLVKNYISEVGSKWVQGIFDPKLGNNILVARITSIEIMSAISRRVREGHISQVDAKQIRLILTRHIQYRC